MSPDTAASNHAFGETLRGSVVTPPGIEVTRGKVQDNNRNAGAGISCSSNSELGYGHCGNCIKIPMQSAGRSSEMEYSTIMKKGEKEWKHTGSLIWMA